MADETRMIRYDNELKIEAYLFYGIMQKFPNHFHQHYVIGFINDGRRKLTCSGAEYIINPGDMILLHPDEPHICEQADHNPLDFRCLNIPPDVMQRISVELDRPEFRRFSTTVIRQSELVSLLNELHQKILQQETDFKKEELLLLLLEQLIDEYGECPCPGESTCSNPAVDQICSYLDAHYSEPIRLDDLTEITGLNKYHLLRIFTRQKGITPYSYLESVRIHAAKQLLEQGIFPADAAIMTGFTDQSHFTNFFKRMIGLTPKQYQRVFEL